MPPTWTFHTAAQITFGPGARGRLGEIARRWKIERLLVVTDQNLIDAGIERQVRQPLQAAGVNVHTFSEGEAEPSVEAALESIQCARDFQPDGILGLGGGSNMDLSKIAATVYRHGGSPHDYFGFDRVPGPILPLICVPTTAGTGSEVSHSAVLTDTAHEMKVSTLSNYLRPAAAVVDPELTYACPRQVTADSGIDALTHAIEAYTATDYHAMRVPPGEKCAYEGRFPLADCLAEKAIELVGRFLVRAVHEGADHEARDAMALAATLAGMAFSNSGVALVHALEYPLGGALHCSHGAGNGMLLPYVMRFNLPVRQSELARIARLLGEDVDGMDVAQSAESAISAVERIKGEIGIPARIRDLGAREDQLPQFAEKAHAIARLRWVNPRESSQEDLLEILKSAF
jgi:alcohol dehydrogenase class IV